MSDALTDAETVAVVDEEPVAAKKTAAQRAVAQKADEALREAQSTKAELASLRQEVTGGIADLRSFLMAAVVEALAAKPATPEDPSAKRKASTKGRAVSDDELNAIAARLSSDDVAQLYELIAAKAENELWADRGINPATHVIATEALKLVYDKKVIVTEPGKDYERAKLNPLDLAQYGETHFTAPRLKK